MATFSGRSTPSADRMTIDALRGVLRQIAALATPPMSQLAYVPPDRLLEQIRDAARRALAATEEK